MRERELKQRVGGGEEGIDRVAPHAGARIETSLTVRSMHTAGVAPHAGARIETSKKELSSPPLSVAPHAGARIETTRQAIRSKAG